MADGDKAAAAGLSVFSASQFVSKVWQYLNIRGDEIAALITRIVKLESNVKATPTIYTPTVVGGSKNTGGGDAGITYSTTIPKASYARVIMVSWQGTCTDHGTASIDLQVRVDGNTKFSTRFSQEMNSHGAVNWVYLPANTTQTYQLWASSTNKWAFSGDDSLTWLRMSALSIS